MVRAKMSATKVKGKDAGEASASRSSAREKSGDEPVAKRKLYEEEFEDDEETTKHQIWLDPDASSLECGICFMPFEAEVFMCNNGHAACAKCCLRINRRCWCCDQPIGDVRCRPAERMLAEMNTLCRFSGCLEVVRYLEKRRHEESCPRAPCHCPVDGCTYRGLLLYSHVLDDHADVVTRAGDLQTAMVRLQKGSPFRVLAEAGEGRVFLLLNGGGVLAGRSLSLVCLGPRPAEGDAETRYKLEVRGGEPGALSLAATAPCVRRLQGFEPKKFLFVPDAEWGPSDSVSVKIRIVG